MGKKSNIWWLVIGVSGILGTLTRAMVYFFFDELLIESTYLSTVLVNISGSFLFSFFASISLSQSSRLMIYRDALLMGFMGSFTTFSSMEFNLQSLLIGSSYIFAFVFLASQLILGVISIKAGKMISNIINRPEQVIDETSYLGI